MPKVSRRYLVYCLVGEQEKIVHKKEAGVVQSELVWCGRSCGKWKKASSSILYRLQLFDSTHRHILRDSYSYQVWSPRNHGLESRWYLMTVSQCWCTNVVKEKVTVLSNITPMLLANRDDWIVFFQIEVVVSAACCTLRKNRVALRLCVQF